MAKAPSSAVVLGASIAGLLAARVLSQHFDRVTLVERDTLPDEPAVRKGVPQGAHAHGLLAGGYRILKAYFPDMMDELEALGARRGDVAGDFLWFQYGRWKLRHHAGLPGMVVSRPCLETAIRRRVTALPNVDLLHAEAKQPKFDPATGSVVGLVVERHGFPAAEEIRADLVVDASGRGSQSPKWLEHWGYGRPQEAAVSVDVGYATRVFRRRPGELYGSFGAIIASTPPAGKRMGGLMGVEGDRWIVTLGGSAGDHPPTDEEGWNRFAASLPVSALYDIVTSACPLTGIQQFRFPANRRRLYERMRRFPGGYLVLGDAVCSFNPIYGQGMTVAASEAQALDEVLASGREGLAQRFYARTRRIIDIPWTIATGEDLRFPEIEGKRPPGTALVNRYLERVHAVASCDPLVCRKFFEVVNLLAPTSDLFSPKLMWRVLRPSADQGGNSPLQARRLGLDRAQTP
ncbi:monooxygenase FAD-binding [Methylobacterium sp. 4-46]|uniref:NAD(P)/FAD-dependent oxidoreductase n=1 Tax=Methylobacterium sp. (strain 4-46) TaxID=426117 RepID=UPI000152C3EA|nr:FAD-binding monooxygenase [Methylobacterium sp. 4-46]ACA18649.1 monooxygenase FAD-binding [Methylobacterium sp. 4-46]